MIGIYKITAPDKRVYIGQSRKVETRWRAYKTLNCEKQYGIYNSLKRHGVDAHEFEMLYTFKSQPPQIALDTKEIAFMKTYRRNGVELLNILPGGDAQKHWEKRQQQRKTLENIQLKRKNAQKVQLMAKNAQKVQKMHDKTKLTYKNTINDA